MTTESHALNDGQELAGVSGYISERPQGNDLRAGASLTFKTIVADPPWDMKRSFGGANWRKGERVRPNLPYPTMNLEEIRRLPVSAMAAQNAHLYLWTTQGFLRHAFGVAEAWGFVPRCVLAWCKPNGGFVGGTFYSNVEFALFCRRGSLAAKRRVNSQWFAWPRGEHSAKPEAFIDMVESVSPGPYLEMFARRNRLGWSTWGNECLNHIGAVALAAQKYNKQL